MYLFIFWNIYFSNFSPVIYVIFICEFIYIQCVQFQAIFIRSCPITNRLVVQYSQMTPVYPNRTIRLSSLFSLPINVCGTYSYVVVIEPPSVYVEMMTRQPKAFCVLANCRSTINMRSNFFFVGLRIKQSLCVIPN